MYISFTSVYDNGFKTQNIKQWKGIWSERKQKNWALQLIALDYDSYICDELIFDKGARTIQLVKNLFSTNNADMMILTCKKIKLDPYLTPYDPFWIKMDQGPKCKSCNYKNSLQKIIIHFNNIGIGASMGIL